MKPEHTAETDVDDVFRALANRRRRRVLIALLEAETPPTTEELVETVATREREERPSERAGLVAIDLTHVQIPHLVDAGLARYATDRDVVVATDRAERIESLLAAIESEIADFES
jgi:hypothetical protein